MGNICRREGAASIFPLTSSTKTVRLLSALLSHRVPKFQNLSKNSSLQKHWILLTCIFFSKLTKDIFTQKIFQFSPKNQFKNDFLIIFKKYWIIENIEKLIKMSVLTTFWVANLEFGRKSANISFILCSKINSQVFGKNGKNEFFFAKIGTFCCSV